MSAFLTWWPVTHLNTRQGEDKVVARPDKRLDMVWERFWSNPTQGGGKSLLLLPSQALSRLALLLEVWE